MKKKALRSIGVFSNLSEESLNELESITKLQYIERNAILHYEGELLQSASLIARGCVELYRMDKNDNEMFLCYVNNKSKGARLINAFGSFEPYIASANVRGVEPSEIVLLDLTRLAQLVASNIEISNALLSEFMDKAIVFKNFINFKETYDSTSRVAYILYNQIEYFNQKQRQVIARELNIKLETLSRILQKMFQQGLIAKNEQNDVYIKDKDAFIKFYGDAKISHIK
ncbi:Crp/Fnr family transcriptional regulator [Helicobacter sp. MIT 21-1697]|uniref:Crp/Fnr family transcriptional regulator n=1 Tax=Helicobacter sp. MIT 21-1697 TaxID=2993733 RepID=UPI00224B893A|nr:Crp/Fnr family transcriptional regulator [Helicobacter sp. MIT 21-1697]MCX2716564.1 Crp/Fnr family transcriptional regulator [Helicobacter sp. MIT 21-1697]